MQQQLIPSETHPPERHEEGVAADQLPLRGSPESNAALQRVGQWFGMVESSTELGGSRGGTMIGTFDRDHHEDGSTDDVEVACQSGFRRAIAGYADPEKACELALRRIMEATRGCPRAVSRFLDGSIGGELGADVVARLRNGAELADAIDVTIERWMSWNTDPTLARRSAIPPGVPVLAAYVLNS